jgi:hypothetical protein
MLSKRITTVVSLVVTLIVLMGVVASPALAETHLFLFSFGSFSNPNGLAVDESSGDVYVADITTATVQKFDANGNLVNFSGLGSNTLTGGGTPAGSFSFPEMHGNPAAIAVDNSTGPSDPSAGDLYVMDAGHEVIDKFAPSGAYLGQIADAGELGIAIDANGDLLVDKTFVDEFDNSVANQFVKEIKQGSSSERGFAVDPTHYTYELQGCGCVKRFAPTGENLTAETSVDNESTGVAIAVDNATGHVYIDDQSSVGEWDPGEIRNYTNPPKVMARGTLVSSFGSLQLSSSSGEGGIAVNGASGNVYVANPADGKVYVFSTAVPSVAAGAPVSVTQASATLKGNVNPHGVPVTSCQFEYGTNGSYGQSVPCAQTPAQIGAGTSAVSVSADISGLQSGILYHFRLQAPNANGTSPSSGLFATVGPGFGIKSYEVSFLNKDGTPDTQAGSHPYEMVTNIAYNTTIDSRDITEPDGNFKDIITEFPPGLVGDPNATATKCTLKQLDTAGQAGGEVCPASSAVGTLEAELGNNESKIIEPVYNMVPPRGVAAMFAAHFIIPNVFIDIGVRAGGDYPIRAVVHNSPAYAPVIATRLIVFGVPSSVEPRTPLLTLPTSCNGPLRSTISADSYRSPGNYVNGPPAVTQDAAGNPIGTTGCSLLKFPPEITVSPDVPDASTSTGLTVGVHVSQQAGLNPEGLAESTLRNTTVTLPEGIAINPAGADGLEACSEGLAGFTGFTEFKPEVEAGVETAMFTPEMPEQLQPGVNFCPDGSKIGTVKITTPLLKNPLEGAVYLATQNQNPFGSLVAMYMFVEDPVSGSLIKLTGEVRLAETGQIVTTFKNTPALPFEDLELHFFGGERAPLTTPSRCGTYTTQASFTPWDGNGPVNTSSSFQITSGPNGGPCTYPGQALPFSPSLTGGATNVNAGVFSPFTLTMSRKDGEQNLQSVEAKLPPGLSGVLSNVELCPEPQANLGECGPNSLIGETTVSVGVGSQPFTVSGGKFYLTGPYNGSGACTVGTPGCAPFGITFEVPAKAGPFDLERNSANPAGEDPCDCVLVRGKIEIDPLTAAITITINPPGTPDAIPTSIGGIPLEIQHINAITTRGNFQFNPTNCSKMEVTGTIHSSEGATDKIGVPFQVTNCASLAFKPQFKVSTSGKTSRAKGASLDVKLAYPKAPFGSQANIRSVKVDLPKQLPSRLTTLQKACPASTFDANPSSCPAASRVGTAKATTPLIPVPLSGPAYFVSHGGAKFPELIIVLQGYGVTVDLHGETFISKAGITSSTFRTVPDVPVGTFELKLPQGSNSALAAPASLCAQPKKLVVPTAFTAQNGAIIHQMTKISVSSCPKHKVASRRRR